MGDPMKNIVDFIDKEIRGGVEVVDDAVRAAVGAPPASQPQPQQTEQPQKS